MRKLAFLALASSALIAGTISFAAAADRYGSVVYSPSTQKYGWSNNARTAQAARRQAAATCAAGDCREILWYKNSCGTLVHSGTGYGSGWGANQNLSRRWASDIYQKCAAPSGQARARTVCTSNFADRRAVKAGGDFAGCVRFWRSAAAR